MKIIINFAESPKKNILNLQKRIFLERNLTNTHAKTHTLITQKRKRQTPTKPKKKIPTLSKQSTSSPQITSKPPRKTTNASKIRPKTQRSNQKSLQKSQIPSHTAQNHLKRALKRQCTYPIQNPSPKTKLKQQKIRQKLYLFARQNPRFLLRALKRTQLKNPLPLLSALSR